MNNCEAIATIYRTYNYELFKRLAGNRPVGEARVQKITRSIDKVGYIMNPIIVNEHYEVIDGQGRLEALKRKEMPVDFVIHEGAGIEECVSMNINQSNWGIEDYISTYAELGNDSYIYLQQLIYAYRRLGISTVYQAVAGVELSNTKIREGQFECNEEEFNRAKKMLDYELRFVPYLTSGRRTRGKLDKMYMAIGFCYNHPDIDNTRLYDKITQNVLDMPEIASIGAALKWIEAQYNYRRHGAYIYIETEYRKYMEGKFTWYKSKWGSIEP